MAHYFVYHGRVSIAGARNLEMLTSEAVQKGATDLNVCLCSGGGDVNAGIGAYNFLRMLPVPVTTIAFGVCGSIAATMFLAGDRRIALAASMFTLHAATFVEGPRTGEVSENTSMIYQPFVARLGWKGEQVQKYFGTPLESFILVDAAKELGIVTEISDLRFTRDDSIVHVNVPT